MNLTDKQIQDFIDAWHADFGETLSPEQAGAEAHRLLDFFVQMGNGLADQNRRTQEREPQSEIDILRATWMKRTQS